MQKRENRVMCKKFTVCVDIYIYLYGMSNGALITALGVALITIFIISAIRIFDIRKHILGYQKIISVGVSNVMDYFFND